MIVRSKIVICLQKKNFPHCMYHAKDFFVLIEFIKALPLHFEQTKSKHHLTNETKVT